MIINSFKEKNSGIHWYLLTRMIIKRIFPESSIGKSSQIVNFLFSCFSRLLPRSVGWNSSFLYHWCYELGKEHFIRYHSYLNKSSGYQNLSTSEQMIRCTIRKWRYSPGTRKSSHHHVRKIQKRTVLILETFLVFSQSFDDFLTEIS